jgi:hypothetical protein
MKENAYESEVIIAIDVGSVTTRALLFDIAGGAYHFIAQGTSRTTCELPNNDIGRGIMAALQDLEKVSERRILDSEGQFIMPAEANGIGFDNLVATISAGPAMRVVCAGLLADVSLESARRLAGMTYSNIIEQISLNDPRRDDTQLDDIVNKNPDVILIAGGTDGGASAAVDKLLETIGLACYVTPAEHRPEVLYAGNQLMVDSVKAALESISALTIAPNVHPTLEVEDLDPVQDIFQDIEKKVKSRYIVGLQELNTVIGGRLMPTATSFGRMMRFLSKVYGSSKGVLGLDVGARFTTIAAGFNGRLSQVVSDLHDGVQNPIDQILQIPMDEITRWIPLAMSDAVAAAYLLNKEIHPEAIPVTPEDLMIEQAAARYRIHQAMLQVKDLYGSNFMNGDGCLKAICDPIILSGKVLTQAPSPAQTLLMLLDSLQPIGVTTLVLDTNNLCTVLGAVADINPMLPVQIIETGSFLSLGTVVSPASRAQSGTPILKVHLVPEDGKESNAVIRQGTITTIPLSVGQPARLYLHPIGGADLGLGAAGKASGFKVTGGILGLVIDARGRPIRLPRDETQRSELVKKWYWMLGN